MTDVPKGGPPPSLSRSREGRMMLIILGFLVLGGVIGAVLWLSGPQPGTAAAPTPRVSTSASAPTAAATPTEATSSARPATTIPTQRPTQATQAATTATAAPTAAVQFPPAGATLCAQGVAAGANTSCVFAVGVANKIPPGGDRAQPFSIVVFSQVTQRAYQMTCSYGAGYFTCTGGNGASAYVLG